MARIAYTLRNFGWTLLAIVALWFVGLATVVIAQLSRGVIDRDDLLAMIFVLRGSHKYVKSNDEYREYVRYLEAREEYYRKLEEARGGLESQAAAAEAAEKRRKIQEDNAAVLQAVFDKEKEDRAALRETIEKQKQELLDLEQAIKDKQEKEAVQALAEKRKKLVKVLAEMDAAQLGEYFAGLLRRYPNEGPIEVARLMHEYLKGDRIAEVMEEMSPEDRQKILPVLEHEYADMAAADIAREWMRAKMRPEIMAAFMKQMPAGKAFMILPHLDSPTKAKVVQALQSADN